MRSRTFPPSGGHQTDRERCHARDCYAKRSVRSVHIAPNRVSFQERGNSKALFRGADDRSQAREKGLGRDIKNAGTGYTESTLVRGSMLLKELGVSRDDVTEPVGSLQKDNYALLRAARVEIEGR